jgi:hypothetical protein
MLVRGNAARRHECDQMPHTLPALILPAAALPRDPREICTCATTRARNWDCYSSSSDYFYHITDDGQVQRYSNYDHYR